MLKAIDASFPSPSKRVNTQRVMRLLIVHPEARGFAGAERVLEYFLEGILDSEHQMAVTVAVARESRCAAVVPKHCERILIVDNGKFSLLRLCQQLVAIRRHHQRDRRFSVVHGWAARDWELSSLLAATMGCPGIGTLHDHPQAAFLSRPRRHLMEWSAKFGLRKVVCVSHAVRNACLAAGYPAAKLAVVHNGLPPLQHLAPVADAQPLRFGFLGVFLERKGFSLLFDIFDELAARSALPWELHLAGEPLDEAGKQQMTRLEQKYCEREWWRRLRWHGWLNDPKQFLASLNLLICPSAQFDPFPTVLLESAQVGVPALAARIGGVEEIVLDNDTGWLFNPGDSRQAAAILERIVSDPSQCRRAGERACRRVLREYPVTKMVAEYARIYSTLTVHV